MKIFKQIVKEFWVPLTLSIAWVLYNIYGNGGEGEWTVKRFVNVFGPTFFLLSWLTGQFFRVKKQTRVEDSFGTMETRFNELLDRVEEKTNEMINHILGGNSFPMLHIANINHAKNIGILVASLRGEHPLYDVTARIVDLQKLKEVEHNLSFANRDYKETNISIGNMAPSQAREVCLWKIENEPYQSYNVFISARNGMFTQPIRLRKVDGTWICATQVLNSKQKTVYEQVGEQFPRDAEGKVIW